MITANLCTIPERQEIAIKAILSLCNQVDLLNVYLNYPFDIDISKLPKRANINYEFTNPKKGDINKFHKSDEKRGIQFICDDDIIYPSTYIQDTLPSVLKFGVVSYHGKNLNNGVIKDFYKDVQEKFHFLNDLENVRVAEICGTGVCAYNGDKKIVRTRKMRYPNMTDIYFSSLWECVYILPHKSDYFQNLSTEGIFDKHKDSNFYQTYEFNRLFR